jgi:hypothetical protein
VAHRFYALVVLVEFALVAGGLAALTGWDTGGSRLIGLAALLGGLVLAGVAAAYLARPVRRPLRPESTVSEDLAALWRWLRKRR